MITGMQILHFVVTPMVAAHEVEKPYWAGTFAFVITFCLWSLYYIALEIEQPFGNDTHDLPILENVLNFNNSLAALLDEPVQRRPAYDHQSISIAKQKVMSKTLSFEDLQGPGLQRVSFQSGLGADRALVEQKADDSKVMMDSIRRKSQVDGEQKQTEEAPPKKPRFKSKVKPADGARLSRKSTSQLTEADMV